MEPFGRQTRKNKRLADRPFYEKLGPTSADIVAEARSSVRTLNTRRPCTPTDSKRTLFSTNLPRPEGRPPSALSGKVQYEESSSRPPSGRARLTPLENAPDIPEEAIVPEPPSTPPGGKPRRPIRTSFPNYVNGDLPSHVPTIASGAPPCSTRPNAKIKAAVIGQSGGEVSLAFCPSPPKVGSPSNTPPSSASITRRNSAGPMPTPPSAFKTEALVTRRVRSGPKERISARSPESDSTAEQTNVNNNNNELISYDVSPKKEVHRTSSGDKRKRKQTDSDKVKDDLTQYHEEQVKPLLAKMEEKFTANNTTELASDCLLLWNILEKKSMLGRASGSSSARRRGEILKTLFKFLDANDSRLVLRLGRLILSMKVTGNNITNICMVIYKLAKTEKNDQMFLEEDMLKYLVETLKDYDILTYRDALVYASGALKHLTNSNASAQQELLTLDTVQYMARILDTICSDISQYSRPERHVSNLLIQVTGVLRYLADLHGARDQYLTHHIIRRLGDILNHFANDEDLVYNISRILSKLTLYNDCCVQLCTAENCFQSLIKALKDFERKQEIAVRLCFILGNLTAKNDEARSKLFEIPSCLSIILSVMQIYFELDQNSKSDSSDTSISTSSNSSGYNNNNNNNNSNSSLRSDSYEDVLVKAIRVIANLSINVDVGRAIAASEVCINMLLQILDMKSLNDSEELVLNTVSTLNNLSFYQDDDSVVCQKHLGITESLLSLLVPENMDAMVEACRVFGNLTRNNKVRKLLADQKVDEILIALLDAGERETVFTACGVLINLMTDDDIRPKLKEEGGIKKLIDVLHDFGKNDWQLAAMVCQTLWNYSGDIKSSSVTFGEEETIELIDVLTDYLDEEAMFDSNSMDNMDTELFETLRDMWEDVFCPVGEKLLQRIKSHHSDLVPLELPS